MTVFRKFTLHAVTFLFGLMLAHPAFAALVNYKPMEFDVEKHLKLQVIGFKGTVKLVGQKAAKSLKIRVRKKELKPGEDSPWKFVVVNKEGHLTVQVKGPEAKSDWYQSPELPEFDILITGKALPTEVFWRGGKVEEKNWKSSLTLRMINGEFVAASGKGERNLSLKDGQLLVTQHEGKAQFDLFNSSLKIIKSDGALEVENFSGKTEILQHKGAVNLDSYNGNVFLNKIEGNLHFDLHRGKLRATEFKGKMVGQSRDSEINVRYIGQSVIDLQSTSGSLAVRSPANSGAAVKVSSSEGVLNVPAHFRWTRLPNLKSARGRLSGNSWSQVTLKSESGNIWVR